MSALAQETNKSKPVVTEGGLAEDVAKLSVNDDKPDADEKPVSESWLDQMTFHVGKIKLTPEGEIPTDQWLNAFCDRADKCYDILFGGGMLAGQLKGDINNSLTTVKKQYEANKDVFVTIEKMIEVEVKARGKKDCFKDKTSACIGQLWTYRALNFLCTFMEYLIKGDLTPSQCGKQTYKDCLERYHGWLARTAVGNAMGWCPTREKIIESFLFTTQDEMAESAKRYVSVLRPLLDQVIVIMDKNDVNFPDKV